MAYQEFLSATAVPLGTRPDGTLRTLIDPTTLLYDSFETLDTTNTWVIGGTVLPIGVAGQLNLAPGATANASSFAKSQPTFTPSSNGWLVYASLYQLEIGAVTGNKRVWGLGAYVTPTFAVPVTNGVVFEIETTTGALQAAVYSNSVRTLVVALVKPTDGLQHRYSITYRGSRVYFDIDGVTVATIQNPSLQVSALSLVSVSINDTVAASAAPVLISTLNGLGDSGRNSVKNADGIYPWRVQTVKAASTAALLTDLPAVVALHPSSPTPNFLSAQAVTGTFFQATQPVSLATNTPDVTDRAARLLGVASIRGLAIAPQSTPFAAAAVGSTVGYDVSAAANATFTVKNTVAATAWTGTPTIIFEQSDDNVSWALLGVVRNDTGLSASTHTLPAGSANTEYMFDTAMEGTNFTRARVTTGTTTGGMTIVVQPGSMPFSPTVTAVLNPETTKVIGTVNLAAAQTLAAVTAITNALPTGANVIGGININQTTPGTTNAVQAVPGTTNGLTPFNLVSAATTNATILKASSGQVYGWYIYNSNTLARKLTFHNSATAPTAGAGVFFSLVIPPGSGANVHMGTGISFSAGIGITTTTGLAANDAVAVALNDLVINIFYK